MDFSDRIEVLSRRVGELKAHIQTEEAAKSSLVMPFIQALGYDIFNPTEVVPEYTADVGTKKGEKVDYAILKDGKPIILFECKCVEDSLDEGRCSQLSRYFANTSARIGVLTDGIVYKFFSDLDRPNIMDLKPFMTFNLENHEKHILVELKKLSKDKFDLEKTLSAAQELKYTNEIKKFLASEFEKPSEDMIRFLASRVYQGRMTQNALIWFSEIVKMAIVQYMNEAVDSRLRSALSDKNEEREEEFVKEEVIGILEPETTQEEFEGFYIIKSILRKHVSGDRIFIRDKKTYCGILFDDNNRKPLCRLHFNGKQKAISLFDKDGNEERISIEYLDDIFAYEAKLVEALQRYLV